MFELNMNLSELEKAYKAPTRYYWSHEYMRSNFSKAIFTLNPFNDNKDGMTFRIPITDEEADILRLLLKIYEERVIVGSVHEF